MRLLGFFRTSSCLWTKNVSGSSLVKLMYGTLVRVQLHHCSWAGDGGKSLFSFRRLKSTVVVGLSVHSPHPTPTPTTKNEGKRVAENFGVASVHAEIVVCWELHLALQLRLFLAMLSCVIEIYACMLVSPSKSHRIHSGGHLISLFKLHVLVNFD